MKKNSTCTTKGAGKALSEDARIERTRTQLTEAVLALASERDITTASVAELTRRAGINRATFYDHASSPVEFLTGVLSADLDDLRDEAMEIAPISLVRDRSRRVLRKMIDHVLRYENVYGEGHASSTYALRVVLAEHVEKSVHVILQGGVGNPPDKSREALSIYAAFLAHGVAGAFDSWLKQPSPRDAEKFIFLIEALYPSWYWEGSLS
ncbi:TetR/AcrR family transcriptional regulator [Xanthomonas sp. NCPPB 2654]|uniref:TetR/AcrR family transcriptional regulator n=1 Tax=unclassified Xanthomonas TaxID=2643310 RepID=UPI0021DFB2A7|nr:MULTISPECIES: TetR/AcrR family transcriptional regulator [unclassified Xanthomonas]MDL5364222.1 TetR/AcrR family transcriptional regulator [Xanthomonas sp. NCPPB 2654]UYC20479.1 TetR/AcrR family transcriptional regulator [Xanthomonas sp. CFBP 8443]